MLEPLWILSQASHVSPECTGCTWLRRMRRFTRNPVCGTKSHLSPILSTKSGLLGAAVPQFVPLTAPKRRDGPAGSSPRRGGAAS